MYYLYDMIAKVNSFTHVFIFASIIHIRVSSIVVVLLIEHLNLEQTEGGSEWENPLFYSQLMMLFVYQFISSNDSVYSIHYDGFTSFIRDM